jgi:hypothetical protein
MTDPASPRHQQMFAAVAAFVDDCRRAYRELPENTYIPSMASVPDLRTFQSGFPYITQDRFSKTPEYTRLFSDQETRFAPIAYGGWDNYRQLIELVRGDPALADKFNVRLDVADQQARSMDDFSVALFGLRTFDRLMHLAGIEFDEEALTEVYCELEPVLLDERLPVWFMAPVALTHFESDAMQPAGPNLFVAKIPDRLNMARMPRDGASTNVNELVLSAATHAVVLTGYTITNRGWMAIGHHSFDWYPTDVVDTFFDALRAVTGYETGYAQIFMVPIGWAMRYQADLPAVFRGAFSRRYPSHFEKAAWNEQRPAVSKSQFAAACGLFGALSEDHGALSLAARRLSAAMLRESEADAILDLLIGLEAILGDQSTTEVTHKLAIRTAAVLGQLSAPARDPVETFEAVRRIYAYRSAVAHGNEKRAEKLTVTELASGPVPTIALARDYLRRVLVALASQPELKSGKEIDTKLVLPALGAAVTDDDANKPVDAAAADSPAT